MSWRSGLSTNKGNILPSDGPESPQRRPNAWSGYFLLPPPFPKKNQIHNTTLNRGLLAQPIHDHNVRTIIGRLRRTPGARVNCKGHESASMNLPSGNATLQQGRTGHCGAASSYWRVGSSPASDG
jgi:hypothetical protein